MHDRDIRRNGTPRITQAKQILTRQILTRTSAAVVVSAIALAATPAFSQQADSADSLVQEIKGLAQHAKNNAENTPPQQLVVKQCWAEKARQLDGLAGVAGEVSVQAQQEPDPSLQFQLRNQTVKLLGQARKIADAPCGGDTGSNNARYSGGVLGNESSGTNYTIAVAGGEAVGNAQSPGGASYTFTGTGNQNTSMGTPPPSVSGGDEGTTMGR